MAANEKGYEFLDHTADIGIRAQAPTLSELFVRMAQGLTELIAEDSALKPQQLKSISVSADDEEGLLLAWLKELLFLFSTERFLPVEYALDTVTPTMLHGTVRGNVFDPARHVQGREVKAITRHALEVRHANGLWQAQVIVDI